MILAPIALPRGAAPGTAAPAGLPCRTELPQGAVPRRPARGTGPVAPSSPEKDMT